MRHEYENDAELIRQIVHLYRLIDENGMDGKPLSGADFVQEIGTLLKANGLL